MTNYKSLSKVINLLIMPLPLKAQMTILLASTVLKSRGSISVLQNLVLNGLSWIFLMVLMGAWENVIIPALLLSLLTIDEPIYTVHLNSQPKTYMILLFAWFSSFFLPLDAQKDEYVSSCLNFLDMACASN